MSDITEGLKRGTDREKQAAKVIEFLRSRLAHAYDEGYAHGWRAHSCCERGSDE